MRISEKKIDEIALKADIVDVVGQYVTLQKKGDRLIGLCPFHTEKTPSFNVSPDKNAYYCFGCGKGGGVFQFIMDIENLSFVESVKFLAEKYSITVDVEYAASNDFLKQKEAKIELYKRVAGSFNYILLYSPRAEKARKYLSERGIEQSIIERFQLGYAPDDRKWLFDFLKGKNYSEKFLSESGLFSKKNVRYPLFSDRLMFPVFNTGQQVVAFSGRDLGERGPKYINSPETEIYHKGSILFGFSQAKENIRKSGFFYLCEGNFDVAAMHQCGFTQSVAPLGTAFTPDQARLLKRYAAKGYIVFDGDEAGKKAAERAGIIMESMGMDVYWVEIPQDSDPAEIVQKQGPDFLKKALQNAVFFFDFLLNYKFDKYKGDPLRQKQEVVKDLGEYLNSIPSIIKREAFIDKIAEKLNLERKTVLLEYAKLSKQKDNNYSIQQNKNGKRISDELYLMLSAAVNRDSFSLIKDEIDISLFEDKSAIDLFYILSECEEENIQNTDILLSKIGDENLKKTLMEKNVSGELLINNREIITDTIRSLKLKLLNRKSLQIGNLLLKAEKEHLSENLINELLLERKQITEQILILREIQGERQQ